MAAVSTQERGSDLLETTVKFSISAGKKVQKLFTCKVIASFLDQNAIRTSRRRRTHARPSGPKPSGSLQERSWQLIQALSLRREEMFQLNMTESSGIQLSMLCR